MSGKREIKCSVCKKWSVWDGGINDRCTHCGSFLDKEAFTNKIEKNIREQFRTDSDWTIIKPEDGRVLKGVKRTALFLRKMLYYFQIAFLAFISFLLWLISLLTA
ncbi:MAG: hypothetical protein H7096_03060 [Flavobacterium sp.]|nr:hypothetical protein [Pedobacter sp.]